MASVTVGVAQGALADVLALSADRVPLLSESPLATNPLFQQQVGDADVRLRAARALLHAEASALWAAAEEGAGAVTPALRSRARTAAPHAAGTAADVVDVAYRAGGSSALYDDSTLQRRLRDMRALTQHFLLKRDTLATCGALLAGQEPDITIF
jgi:alkylation response protein AidB-like acyl-CoA dehydrogenase